MQNAGYRLSQQILKKNLPNILKCQEERINSLNFEEYFLEKFLTTQTDHFYFLGLLERKRQEFW